MTRRGYDKMSKKESTTCKRKAFGVVVACAVALSLLIVPLAVPPRCRALNCGGGAEHEVCISRNRVKKQIRSCSFFMDFKCMFHRHVAEYTRARWPVYANDSTLFIPVIESDACVDTYPYIHLAPRGTPNLLNETHVLETLDSLARAHGDVLFDLSSSNIRADRNGTVVVIDLSILPHAEEPLLQTAIHGLQWVSDTRVEGYPRLYAHGWR